MSGEQVAYLVGIILTALALVPLIWAIIWQVKLKKAEKNRTFTAQEHGYKRYYNAFIFYLLVFALTADVLGLMLLSAFLATYPG
jgi:hypothetical protein